MASHWLLEVGYQMQLVAGQGRGPKQKQEADALLLPLLDGHLGSHQGCLSDIVQECHWWQGEKEALQMLSDTNRGCWLLAHAVYQVCTRSSADNWSQHCYRDGDIAIKGRNREAMWLSDSLRVSLIANR